MNNPKSPTIKLLAQAIGDGTIKVHFRHILTRQDYVDEMAQYVFEVNGVQFETGWHDAPKKGHPLFEGMNDYLIATHDINTVSWFVGQHDTRVLDVEKRSREAQAAIDKAMNALLGPCPF